MLRTTMSELFDYNAISACRNLSRWNVSLTRRLCKMGKSRKAPMHWSANVSLLASLQATPTRRLDCRTLIETCNGLFRPKNPISLIRFAYLCDKSVSLPKWMTEARGACLATHIEFGYDEVRWKTTKMIKNSLEHENVSFRLDGSSHPAEENCFGIIGNIRGREVVIYVRVVGGLHCRPSGMGWTSIRSSPLFIFSLFSFSLRQKVSQKARKFPLCGHGWMHE